MTASDFDPSPWQQVPPGAYLLVSHGSRDPRSRQGQIRLATQVAQALGDRCLVETAVLELGPVPLHQQIATFCDRAQACGLSTVKILPLFLLAGVHVREDLPAEVAQAQPLSPLPLHLLPHLGAGDALLPVLRAQQRSLQFQIQQAQGAEQCRWVLMAHGSRRSEVTPSLEALATRLEARLAYWVGSPSLGDRLTELWHAADAPIGLLSYFLFEGGITDGLQAQYQTAMAMVHQPAAVWQAPPLAAFPELAQVVGQCLAIAAPGQS